jgi:hypothetical protein
MLTLEDQGPTCDRQTLFDYAAKTVPLSEGPIQILDGTNAQAGNSSLNDNQEVMLTVWNIVKD